VIEITETVTRSSRKTVAVAPSDVAQIGIVARYDVLKYLRSRRLLGMVAIVVLVILLITALPPLLGESYPDGADAFMNMYAGYVAILVIVGATLFAGDAIVSEFQNRTGYLLFPKPVKRWALLAGKFLASMAAMFLVLLVYYAIVLALGLVITGGFSSLGVESLLLAMMYSVAALSVGYLISSIMRGTTGAQVLTFAMFLFIFTMVVRLLTVGDVKPWFVLTFAGDVIGYITLEPYPMEVTPAGEGPIAVSSFVPDVGVSMAVMVAYALASLMLTYFFFKRREMSA
jgi:ABC-type transport system involved in multi-copper enzyme maturation permease subunit